MVTAETALVLPSVVILLGVLVWVAVLITAQVRVVDAARAGARAAARGESWTEVVARAEAVAPPGARTAVVQDGREVRVEVIVDIPPIAGLPVLPSVRVDAAAYAVIEGDLAAAAPHEGDAVALVAVQGPSLGGAMEVAVDRP